MQLDQHKVPSNCRKKVGLFFRAMGFHVESLGVNLAEPMPVHFVSNYAGFGLNCILREAG